MIILVVLRRLLLLASELIMRRLLMQNVSRIEAVCLALYSTFPQLSGRRLTQEIGTETTSREL
ncbi:hypothetical protein [Sphaerospermopsis torques-reginae]|uniref:Transposase n=1 Tax=Sphaerospermopsis torques-reginae ITEP-024 TaxID=984208 RepID=A0ABX8WXI9_9CYAN|nr:hypothetical protein [Sphaerospermopsis torques-reginae]QYX31151.1 hypothetical protein K2F26_20260 [Sphaerospermopsis torques-reginae ITEP-024]